jgi:hypothetical protein
MQTALQMIAEVLRALLAIPGFAGSVIFELHVIADRKEVKVIPKIQK